MSAATLGSADVAIVGGGLMGSAAAYYLAKGGVDVAVLERGSANREASGSNAGSLHLQIYIHPHFPEDWIERIRPSIALMREAAKGWATMESELGTDCGIRLGGGLWVAETSDEMRLIEKKVIAEGSMGVESTVLLRNELLAVAPYLGPHVIGGSFLKGEGFANPLLVTPAHTKAAARHGAKFFSDAPVRSITRQRDGGFVVETGRGALRARQVVSAAGAWTAELGRMVGLKIPVTGAAGQVIVTEGRPPIMLDHLLQHVGKGLTLKQSRQGTFIIGGGWPGHYDPVCGRCVPLLDSIVGNCWVATRTVPEIARAQLVRGWSGMGSGVPDGLPIIGESSAVKGFHVLYAPLGFTMGPICGKVFAENFLTGDATVPVAPYTPDRFQ
jgi:glycine/D-amino acid oxidase-like deaminating enzyme